MESQCPFIGKSFCLDNSTYWKALPIIYLLTQIIFFISEDLIRPYQLMLAWCGLKVKRPTTTFFTLQNGLAYLEEAVWFLWRELGWLIESHISELKIFVRHSH